MTQKDEQNLKHLVEKVTQVTARLDLYDRKMTLKDEQIRHLEESVTQLADRLDLHDRKITEKDEQIRQLMETVTQLTASAEKDGLRYVHSSDSDSSHILDERPDPASKQNQSEQSDEFKKIQNAFDEKHQRERLEKEEKIKQLTKKVAQLSVKPEICVEKLPVTAWQREIIAHCFGTFDDCEVSYRDNENVALIKGPQEKVREHQLNVLTELKKIKEEAIVLKEPTSKILSSEKGKMYLKNVIDSGQSNVRAFVQDGSLVVEAKEADVLKICLNKLKPQLNYVETTTSNADLPLAELRSLKAEIERDLLVEVSWYDDGKIIKLEGIKDDVLVSKQNVQQLIEEDGVHEKVFEVKEQEAKLLNQFYSEQINNVLESVEVSGMVKTDTQILLKLKGNKSKVQEAHRKLQELETKIQRKTWILKSEFKNSEDTMLIAKGYNSKEMKTYIEYFEITEKCLVIPQFPSIDTSRVAPTKLKGAQRRQKKTPLPPPISTKPKLFNVTGTCRLVIKPYGDITDENSDVLVCVLDQKSMDLRKTRVGQAFITACPSLWKEVQEKHAKPSDSVLVTKGGSYSPLKCKAICHVILFPWNPNTSPEHLSNAVSLVLGEAVSLGAQSVSFPALGCGRAFGFPASDVAQIVLSCINARSVGDTLKKVVLLAPDQELFKEFMNAAPSSTSFSALVSQLGQPQSALSGIAASVEDNDDDDESDEDSTNDSEDNSHRYQMDSQTQQTSCDSQITLMNLHGEPLEKLWSTLKDKIKKHCLHVDQFNQESSYFWPRDSRNHIMEEAKKLCVWVERSVQPKTKTPGYTIKGTRKDVDKMMNVIKDEFLEISAILPGKKILSRKSPNRGTVAFLNYAASSDEPFPSYWSRGEKKTRLAKVLTKKEKYLAKVDSKTKDAITKLISQTWDQNLVGHGNDAKGLQHSGIQVISIHRVENPHLFEQYRMQRKRLFVKTAKAGKICPDIGKLSGSQGKVVTTEKLDDFMKEELYWEINEHYLFHGTKPDVLNALINHGIDPKVSSQDAMFGKGIYAAEKVTKSDQYTDSPIARTPLGTELYLILSRMLLGNVFLCDDKHPTVASKGSVKLARPPCVHCLKDKCGCKNQTLFDSVMGDGKWLFREFVVYETNQCYPEYIIKYKRV